jgi:DNA (cytosine-5)-methyltransferase 1
VPKAIGIVDLFAGPGGLGEGFAALDVKGFHPFRIGVSVEKESSAHRTLTLRAFLREYRAREGRLPQEYIDFHAGMTAEPDWASVDRSAWKAATGEALCLELGSQVAAETINSSIRRMRRNYEDTVLIGGPPCQAYSLVGRVRSRGKKDYVPEKDERHFLFREYIRVLDQLRPAAFVMENVKGILSSAVDSRLVFEMLMEDLSTVGSGRGQLYELRAVHVEDGRATLKRPSGPSEFVVRAEEFGVPQKRHRVIIVGIRADLAAHADTSIAVPTTRATVDEVIGKLARLRSGLSSGDEIRTWQNEMAGAAKRLAAIHSGRERQNLNDKFNHLSTEFTSHSDLPRRSSNLHQRYGRSHHPLINWLECSQLRALAQHESRGHMISDLHRYLFAAVFAEVRGYSPKSSDFPLELTPDHRNWHSGVFADRFRVQLKNEPSTTITSHISKDGHYFIHPDPRQCRSLTVRESARLQTFPDDYIFLGTRTQQYVQIGNAVPPFFSKILANLLYTNISG